MFLYSCILLALVSAVKASVIINVYEADGEVKASHSLRDCNASDCDRFCRRAGFKKGSCVNNRCRCTSFLDLTENKADHSVDSCNYQACDQLCRRLGFPGGACVGDKCKCDNFKPIEIKENKAEYSVRDSCNYRACDQLCRRLGFPGGACVGNKCECDNFEPVKIKGTDEDTEVEDTEKSESEKHTSKLTSLTDVLRAAVGSCNIIQCDDMCHRLNYAGGTCTAGSCECF